MPQRNMVAKKAAWCGLRHICRMPCHTDTSRRACGDLCALPAAPREARAAGAAAGASPQKLGVGTRPAAVAEGPLGPKERPLCPLRQSTVMASAGGDRPFRCAPSAVQLDADGLGG